MLQCTGMIAIVSVSILCLGSYAEMFACVLPHPRACFVAMCCLWLYKSSCQVPSCIVRTAFAVLVDTKEGLL